MSRNRSIAKRMGGDTTATRKGSDNYSKVLFSETEMASFESLMNELDDTRAASGKFMLSKRNMDHEPPATSWRDYCTGLNVALAVVLVVTAVVTIDFSRSYFSNNADVSIKVDKTLEQSMSYKTPPSSYNAPMSEDKYNDNDKYNSPAARALAADFAKAQNGAGNTPTPSTSFSSGLQKSAEHRRESLAASTSSAGSVVSSSPKIDPYAIPEFPAKKNDKTSTSSGTSSGSGAAMSSILTGVKATAAAKGDAANVWSGLFSRVNVSSTSGDTSSSSAWTSGATGFGSETMEDSSQSQAPKDQSPSSLESSSSARSAADAAETTAVDERESHSRERTGAAKETDEERRARHEREDTERRERYEQEDKEREKRIAMEDELRELRAKAASQNGDVSKPVNDVLLPLDDPGPSVEPVNDPGYMIINGTGSIDTMTGSMDDPTRTPFDGLLGLLSEENASRDVDEHNMNSTMDSTTIDLSMDTNVDVVEPDALLDDIEEEDGSMSLASAPAKGGMTPRRAGSEKGMNQGKGKGKGNGKVMNKRGDGERGDGRPDTDPEPVKDTGTMDPIAEASELSSAPDANSPEEVPDEEIEDATAPEVSADESPDELPDDSLDQTSVDDSLNEPSDLPPISEEPQVDAMGNLISDYDAGSLARAEVGEMAEPQPKEVTLLKNKKLFPALTKLSKDDHPPEHKSDVKTVVKGLVSEGDPGEVVEVSEAQAPEQGTFF